MIPFWIFMTALAFPLVLIATASIGSSIYASTVELQENNDPIVFSSNTVWLGPFSVATNVRGWAGLCVVLGIVLTAIGLIGLFHFPTPSPAHLTENTEQIDSANT
ncbi:MAG: hypothetical protein ACK52L_05455 [Pirellula sp.]